MRIAVFHAGYRPQDAPARNNLPLAQPDATGTVTRMRNRRGYTLVEIAVVLLVLTAISGIGISSLLGTQEATNESTAKNHLETAVSTQLTYMQQYGRYAVSTGDLDTLSFEGTTFTTGPSTDQFTISVVAGTSNIGLAVEVDADQCVITSLDALGNGPEVVIISTTGGVTCTGAAAL